MKFHGTRDNKKPYTLKEAAIMGLAPCGGLFMPEKLPTADLEKVCCLAKKSYADMATYLSSLFFGDDLSYNELSDVCHSAYNFEVNLHRFDDDISTLELFGGPTLAFKDFGARFMSRMLAKLYPDQKIKIVTATSGDTGSAVAAGFYMTSGTEVYIMYPSGRVSDFQERQMTTLGGNIKALRVDGSFDDCQAMAKELFSDSEFCKKHRVTSANSISLLRWIPQSFYYFWLYAALKERYADREFNVVIPSGNYGNISAAILAKKMGLKLGKLIAASNSNDIVPKYLKTGVYSPKNSVKTLSNAMDVGAPSNFERLMELSDDKYDTLKNYMSGFSCDDNATKSAIKEVYDKYGYIIDPHSAIGYLAAKNAGGGVFVSTAHSAKFKEVIEPVLNINLEYPQNVLALFEKQKQFISIGNDTDELKGIISHPLKSI